MSLSAALRSAALVATLAYGFAAGPVSAAALTGEQVLEQFNLVVLGNMSGGHDVEGRALIQGNLTGNSTTFFKNGNTAPSSQYPALMIGGNQNANSINVNNGGSIEVGGNVTKNINMNGNGNAYVGGSVTGGANINTSGTKVIGQPVPVAIPTFTSVMTGLSNTLKALTANATASISANTGIFNASGLGNLVTFNIANGANFFNSIGQISFTLGSASTVIINVGGTTLNIAENWLNGVGTSVADNIVWNFYEATSITFGTEFFGAVLAPYATVSNNNALNGSVVVKEFNQGGEVHQYQFSGDLPGSVPEPMTLGLLGISMLGLFAATRRKKAA